MKKLALCALILGLASVMHAAEKKIVLIAGKPSHRPGEHEHNAGMLLLQKCLAGVPGIMVQTHLNGWPADPAALEGAATIAIYCDGGHGHPVLIGENIKQLGAAVSQGAGVVLIHYAVEPTKERGQKEFLGWVGGCFEVHWSVNPHWDADFQRIPQHPVSRGVNPFKLRDEWYYHMRFVEGMKGVTPLLSDLPPKESLERPDGPHSGNPDVRAAIERGEPQHVAWAFERADGGRGFATTGGHFHKNWGNDDFRKLVLNAILWVGKIEVPVNGVVSTLSAEDLQSNLDPKGGRSRKGAYR